MCQKRISYNLNALRQYVCLVTDPITFNIFDSLHKSMPVGRSIDSVMVPI